jgi:hypothetical protein
MINNRALVRVAIVLLIFIKVTTFAMSNKTQSRMKQLKEQELLFLGIMQKASEEKDSEKFYDALNDLSLIEKELKEFEKPVKHRFLAE